MDDEPLVLAGLRRSVYTEFAADLAGGPEEGLAKLKKDGPYPVVVSDMRMPAMDGADVSGDGSHHFTRFHPRDADRPQRY